MELLCCFKTTDPCNIKQYKTRIQIFRTVLNLYLHAYAHTHTHVEYHYTCCHLTNLPMPTIAHNHPPLLLVCNTKECTPNISRHPTLPARSPMSATAAACVTNPNLNVDQSVVIQNRGRIGC